MRLRAAGLTDKGRVRSVNQDAFYCDKSVFAVADGMGGHRAGDIASRTAIERFEATLNEHASLSDAIRAANRAVITASRGDSDLTGMGTTFTAARIADDGLTIAHVGDSRAYLLRGGVLRQLTDDHSYVAELVRAGRLTEAEARVHPNRSLITRALGIQDDIAVDVHPEALQPGDRLLLCSDGLSGMLTDDRLGAYLGAGDDPAEIVTVLVDAANAQGGEDNITAVVVFVDDISQAEAVPPSRRKRRLFHK